ncbi:MAG: hypothetical protein D3906_07165 [Candidatus Electrothrix sp. AUS1_2]|nr:hypothetical protein [Candidatus Electrothrix sp. AUS1_2]
MNYELTFEAEPFMDGAELEDFEELDLETINEWEYEDDQNTLEPELLEGEWEMPDSAECSCGGREMEEFVFEAEPFGGAEFEEREDEAAWNSPQKVRWIQESLNKILRLRLKADGIMGPQTRSAIRSFQQKNGLVADGVVGRKTEAAIAAQMGVSSSVSGGAIQTTVPLPLPVPVETPVQFALLPPIGSYWPVISSIKDARVVSYRGQRGTIGSPGRMFLADRGKLRWHVGVDLFANINDVVVSCEDGKIIEFKPFYKAKSNQQTYSLLIQHDGSGVVANYGEITENSLRDNGLKTGSRVKAGQRIGFISDTGMLHFETYVTGTKKTHRWLKNNKFPPPALRNPTRYLLFLKEHGLPNQIVPVSGYAPSLTRQRFEEAAARSNWREAFLNLNGLNMFEMLRALNGLVRERRDALMNQSWNFRGIVNMPRIEYAMKVVQTRNLPSTAPGDLAATGQVQAAIEFLKEKTIVQSSTCNPFKTAFEQAAQYVGVPVSWADNPALCQLIKHESSWNPSAKNPTSSAFGLFQFLKSTWKSYLPEVGYGNTEPYWQAVGGFRYIQAAYRTPERAWAFWQSTVKKNPSIAPSDLQKKAMQWIEKGWGGYEI